MSTEREQQPRHLGRAGESAPDPPGPALVHTSDQALEREGGASIENPHEMTTEAAGTSAASAASTADGDGVATGPGELSSEEVREHLRRRAAFLRELAEARELRRRVTPHRSRRARIHAALRRRTFRIN
ncbi:MULTISPECIES: hypothetical protein [Thermomonosporaceae]|uniref:hypothetical protein n=1 Tax=Thermomonosporaceae TaxID=2012 RepID=UPI00255A944A|nr:MULTISPECIES: hypothetical protein [Thermomonosporaceae]MDL4773411.1 hypothetical protein [Actinomadura xylanilytica]